MDRPGYFIETCEMTVSILSKHPHPIAILGVGVGAGRAPSCLRFFSTREEPQGITAACWERGWFRKLFRAVL